MMIQEYPIVYLNGRYVSIHDATISVLDRGFLFGDGVYEVIPVYGGRPFRLAEHLQRLDNSLSGLYMSSPLSASEWQDIFDQLIQKDVGDQYLYLQITRGVAPKRDHMIPKDIVPTVFVMCSPIPPFSKKGIRAVTVEDVRWHWCHIKAITLLANVLLRQTAIDQDAEEAILIRDGQITEGTASNVFVLLEGVLLTPPKSHDLLPGITRDVILELAHNNGLSAEERNIPVQLLSEVSEVWISSSTREIVPVIEINGRPVGIGEPGPLWKKMNVLYQAYKSHLRLSLLA